MVLYTMSYKAIVFRPFIGEVLDAKVSTVTAVRRVSSRARVPRGDDTVLPSDR